MLLYFSLQGNSFFVMTNYLKSEGQEQKLCPEVSRGPFQSGQGGDAVKGEMHSGKELFACLSLRACVNTSPLFSLPLFCPSAPDTADPLSSGRSVLAMSSLPTWPATPCCLSVSFSVLWWRGHLLSTPKAVPESASWLPGRLLLHFYSVLFLR